MKILYPYTVVSEAMRVRTRATHNLLQLGAALITLLVVVGCAGGGGSSLPVVPDIDSGSSDSPGVESRLELTRGESGWDADRSLSSSHQLWMYRQVYVDPATREFEIIPHRSASVHLNVVSWLEKAPCTDCLSITNITPSDHETLLVDLQLRHPFTVLNLTGFDVRGIVMFTGSLKFPISGHNTSDPEAGDGALINPDGYTALYNPATEGSGGGGLQGYIKGEMGTIPYPDATLNGFKRYISDDPGNTRNAFYVAETITQTLDIDMPDGPFIFGYAVDANWAEPLNKPVTDPMTEFPPEANCPEPWMVSVAEEEIGQGLTNYGGSTKLIIDVYDWGGKDTHLAPIMEAPGLFADTVTATWDEPGSGPAFSRWEAVISIDAGLALEEYPCLISVEDIENETAPDYLDLTAYQIYTAEVEEFEFAYPIAIADSEPKPQIVCAPAHFFDDGSYDPDGGSILKYEWDWECDGTYDEVGSDAYHTWNQPGEYCVQFRVTDNDGATDELDVSMNVEIINALPTADAEPLQYTTYAAELISFDGSNSHDNDCDDQAIVQWEWDWENDGVFDDLYDVPDAGHSYAESGDYEVQLRVTDDEGGTDILDDPLLMHIIANLDPIACGEADTTTPTVCEPVHFTDCGSYDPDGGDIVKYEWDWDNDGVYDEEGNDVYHTWDAVGTFFVQYRVTDDEDATDELDEPLEIQTQNALPTVVASAGQYSVYVCEEIAFDATESYDNDCGGQEIVQWEWDWDDDGTYDAFGSMVVHSWDEPDIYPVQCRVTDDEGGTDELDDPLLIAVSNALPTAVASVSTYTPEIFKVMTFDGSDSYDNDCDGQEIVLYEWDWDNNEIFDETGEVVVHAFDTPGMHYVQLRVTDDEEGTATLDEPLEIIVTACPTGIHTFNVNRGVDNGMYGYSVRSYSVLPRVDIAYIESGVLAGRGIVQGGDMSLISFDADVDSVDPIDDAVLMHSIDVPYNIMVTSLDASPYGSEVALVTSDNPSEIKLIDPSFLPDPAILCTLYFEGSQVMAVDFNYNGDLWVVLRGSEFITLNSLEFVGAPDYYSGGSYAEVPGWYVTDVFDIAINWFEQMLYVFRADAGGTGAEFRGAVTTYDISTGSPVMTGIVNELFSDVIEYEVSLWSGASAFADIEIDHMGGDDGCHIVLYAVVGGMAVVQKRDMNMNLIDEPSIYADTWPSMTINPEANESDRNLLFPGTDKLAFWSAPGDW